MAPTATATKEAPPVESAPAETKPDKAPFGVRAVLLGPPGSGKGTQVGAAATYARCKIVNILIRVSI